MYPNTITSDLNNYFDGSHVYPDVETLIAHKITGYPDNKIPADFGILLTKNNFAKQMNYIDGLMEELR
jgi:hypothetical protein